MILYFADRKMNILGQASTSLPEGVIISNDRKTEEVDEGVAILEFDLEYDPEWRKKAEAWTEAGNYILRKDGDDREFYTIISREKDPVNGSVNDIYAEDAGLDLLNEVVGAYKADKAYSAEFYIKKFSYDSGFEVGVNEVSNLTRKLSWDGEATATERLLSVATQFDNAEISFSFDVDQMSVVHKYINIFKRRGVDSGVQLQIGREIKKIRIKDTIEDLATAYVCTGGIPDGKDDPITLAGYKYDDGDFYVEGTHLNSRKALQKWSRYQIKTETGDNVGHIVKTFSYDTTSQSELCNRAVSSLKKICDVNTTYEIELSYLPQGTKIGDTVYIIDHTGELYLSSRLLKIETSVCDNTKTAELGEYSVKSSGVSEKLRELADAFAKVAQNRKFYTWIAYADDDIGTGASLDSYGKEYLGIASNRVTRDPDLTDPTVYTWIKIRGEQGIPGTSGKDGKTSYFHVKYSDVEKPASYSDMTETPSKYIGTYVDYELEDSKDPSKYTWSKFQGEDGADGVAGKNGENGETSYVHFAYATSEDGKTNFSTTDPTDKTYIGQYVDFKKADSEQPEKYRWSKFQGPKGPAGSDGEQGYGIVASVTRENFTEDQWNSTYGMTGHLASWTGTSALRNGCRIGDIFVVVGTATDTKNAHTAYYRSDTDAGDLQGICIGHTIAFRGSAGIDGTDGKGIESIKEHYAVSTSNTVTPTVWFDDVLVTNSVNKYLWSYETITYTDGTSVDSNKRVIGTYGDTGKDGATGADGKGIKSTVITYQASTSGTAIPTGTWQTDIPTVSAGQYLWTRTVITYTDNSKSTSYSVGRMGINGANGTNGSAGRGIKSTAITYQAGSSGTTAPTGTWQTTVPATSASSPYLWTRTIITYTDDTTSTSYAVGSTLEGVSVGGRNLARKTSNKYCAAFNSFNGGDNICPNLATVSTAGLTVGDKVTVRLVYKYTNIVAVTGKTAAAWLQGAGNITEWKSGTFVSNQRIALSGSGEKVIKYSFVITSDMIKNQCWYVNIRHDGVKSGSVQWREFKVEKGNIATDWTPAPEDNIASVDVEYYLSTSATALSGGSWSTTAPTWVNGKYMWSRTVTTDGAGNKTYSPNQNGVCIAGAKGETGLEALQCKRVWKSTYTNVGGTTNCGVDDTYFNRTPVVGDVFTALDASSNTGTWEITAVSGSNATIKLLSYVNSKGSKGETGTTGSQGYGIVANVVRENFTETQWSTYGTIGHEESWANTSGTRNGCRVGDIFTITGNATDTRSAHVAYYKSTTASGDLHGICMSHTIAPRGATGPTGGTGPAGKGIKSIVEQYYKSTSATAISGGSWGTTYPGWESGKYIWTRSVITYTDKTTTTTTAVCVTGTKGSTGNDGKTSYVHMAYANITYVCEENNSFTLTSTTVCRYGKNDKWVYKTLEAGTYTGNTTLFGSDPANGVVKEVNKITGFSITDSSGRAYMGQYTDFEQAGSNDISKYVWTKVQGPKGETGNKGETGASGKNALQPKRNWSGTFTTIGATAIAATTDFNRTPVVGDVFINLDGSSNTGTWQVTALSGTSVTIKLLSYVNSKGAPGKDANQVVHSVAGNGNTNKYIEFATVKVIANYANYATTFKISGREYETTDVQFSFVSDNNTDPKLYFLRATGEFNVWMYKKTTSTWGLVTKLNEAWGYMRVYNFQPGNDCISLTWTDTRHASLPSGCIAADQLQAAKTATNFMEFTSGTGLQIGDKTNGTWKGFRSRITSTAFEILNEAGTAVASYGRKLIQLGKDSVDAVIELCGGKGSIKHENVGVYGETKSTLTVNGVNLGLLADDSVIIRSERVDGDNTTYTSQIYMTKGRIDIATFTELEDGTVTSSNGVDIDDNIGIDIGVPGATETALSKARINGRSLLDFLHPVGSIYMSTSATNPTNLFGGTWVAWGAGRVPVGFNGGDGNFNSSEKTGGSKTINIQHNHGLSNARAAVGRADSSTSTISYTAGGNPHNVYFDREFSYWGGIAGVSKHATDTAKIYGNTDNGGSTAASVLQPYITCYMWKRTA